MESNSKKVIYLLIVLICALGTLLEARSMKDLLPPVSEDEVARVKLIGNLREQVHLLGEAMKGRDLNAIVSMADPEYKQGLVIPFEELEVIPRWELVEYEVLSMKVYGQTGVVSIRYRSAGSHFKTPAVYVMFWRLRDDQWFFRSLPPFTHGLPEFPNLPSCLEEGI